MGEIFWAKLYCRMSELFCQFLWASRIYARKSKNKKKLQKKEIHKYFK